MSVDVGELLIVIPIPLCLKSIAEWLSGDRSREIGWSTTSNNNLIYHTVGLQDPAIFNEINAQADWGTLYYAMKSVSGTDTICISPLIDDDLGW
jgi:hypothetical protein